MTFENNEISQLTAKALKHLTSESERLAIAKKRGISIHTLNSVLNRQRKISHLTVRPLLDVTHLAIINANKRDTNLAKVRSSLAEMKF
jgi:DNA invertase Pin-like site-specific DNA recombinase